MCSLLSMGLAFFVKFTFIPALRQRHHPGICRGAAGHAAGARADRAMRRTRAPRHDNSRGLKHLHVPKGRRWRGLGRQFSSSLTIATIATVAHLIQQELRPLLGSYPGYRVTAVRDQGGGQGSDNTVQFVGKIQPR